MYIFKSIFFNSTGSFEWASITGIIAIVGFGYTCYNNKQILKQQEKANKENFEGNIVAKARIEWIQEVRKRSVDFIASCYELIEYKKQRKQTNEQIIRLSNKVESNATLLILYFGPDHSKNEDNEFIVFMISVISSIIIDKDGDYDVKRIDRQADNLEVLKDFLRIYFKAEWKRANKDIKEEEVEKYLKENKIYNRIKEIYSKDFECHKEWVDNFYSQLERHN